MLFIAIGSIFAARTPFRGRSAANKAASLGHREGSMGIQTFKRGNDDVSCRRERRVVDSDVCRRWFMSESCCGPPKDPRFLSLKLQ
jgi:hypothetical protein